MSVTRLPFDRVSIRLHPIHGVDGEGGSRRERGFYCIHRVGLFLHFCSESTEHNLYVYI